MTPPSAPSITWGSDLRLTPYMSEICRSWRCAIRSNFRATRVPRASARGPGQHGIEALQHPLAHERCRATYDVGRLTLGAEIADEPLGELGVAESTDVVAVEPRELVEVEHRADHVDAGPVERVDELIEREHLSSVRQRVAH